MIIKNIDNGLKTFGNGKPFARVSFEPASRALSSDLISDLGGLF